MSILLEPISIVVRVPALEAAFPGGVEGFAWEFCNGSFRRDADLAAVSYFSPFDADSIISQLVAEGLEYGDRAAEDIAVFDAGGALWLPCLWLEIDENPDGLAVGRLAGGADAGVSVPDYFDPANPAGSMASLHRICRRDLDARISPLRRERDLQLMLDRDTGRVLRGALPLARQ